MSTANEVRLAIIAILVCAMVVQQGTASANASDEPDVLVVATGYYEHIDELGLIGLVTTIEGDMATFITCNGPVEKYKIDRLRRTKFDCEDSSSPDTNPMAVNCSDYDGAWTDSELVASVTSSGPSNEVGFYIAETRNAGVELVELPQYKVSGLLAMVAVMKVCGELLTGFDKAGAPVLNLYPGNAFGQRLPAPRQ